MERISIQVPFMQLSKIRQFQSNYLKKEDFEKKKQMHKSSYNVATLLELCGQTRARELKYLLIRSEEKSKKKSFFTKSVTEPVITNPFNIGDSFVWGSYPVYENGQRAPIDWYVIKTYPDRLILLSKKAIECLQFSNERYSWNWNDSSLRKWLNNDFIDIAFSEDEKNVLVQTEIKSSTFLNLGQIKKTAVLGNIEPLYDPAHMLQSYDKAFLLNANEYKDLPDTMKKAKFTNYLEKRYEAYQLSMYGSFYRGAGFCEWDNSKTEYVQKWYLRDRGRGQDKNYSEGPLFVESKFEHYYNRWSVKIDNEWSGDPTFIIRPAICISLTRIVEIYGRNR